jgi:hypothetical protein
MQMQMKLSISARFTYDGGHFSRAEAATAWEASKRSLTPEIVRSELEAIKTFATGALRERRLISHQP